MLQEKLMTQRLELIHGVLVESLEVTQQAISEDAVCKLDDASVNALGLELRRRIKELDGMARGVRVRDTQAGPGARADATCV